MITINSKDFKNGVSDSKFLGISGMVNLDIEKNIGALSILNKIKKIKEFDVNYSVDFVIKNNINEFIFFVKQGNKDEYKIWILKTNNTLQKVGGTITGEVKGAFTWENYFLYIVKENSEFKLKHLERKNDSLVDPSFKSKEIKSLNIKNNIFSNIFVSKDNQVYFSSGDGHYISRMTKKLVRDENNDDSDIYDILHNGDNIEYQAVALDLPKGNKVTTINELNYIYFACENGNIFTWDRIRESFFSEISTGVSPIIDSINYNNELYYLGGLDATLFTTNSTNYRLLTELNSLSEDRKQKYYGNYGNLDISDGLFIGIGKNFYDRRGNGIWQIKEGKKTFFEIEGVEPINDSNTNPDSWTEFVPGGKVKFLNIKNKAGNKYFISVYEKYIDDSFKNYINITDKKKLYDSGYFETGFYRLGDYEKQKKIEKFDIYFSQKLKIGEGFKIEYRENVNEQYKQIGYYVNKKDSSGGGITPAGEIQNHKNAIDIKSDSVYTNSLSLPLLRNIQFKVTLFSNHDNTRSPEFLEIKFK